MNKQNNSAHITLHAAIAGLVFSLAAGGVFHFAPYHQTPAAVISTKPADCLPSGNGGPCLPFDKIQEMMEAQPDAPEVIPTNPATANEEKI